MARAEGADGAPAAQHQPAATAERRREHGIDDVPVVVDAVEQGCLVALQHGVRHVDVPIDDLVISVLEKCRRVRIETADDPQPRGGNVDDTDVEFGAVLLEAEDGLPDVAAPRERGALPRRRLGTDRITVVDEDDRARVRVPTDVDDVTECELEVVHPVDERKVERRAVENSTQVELLEEVVAREREHRRVERKPVRQPRQRRLVLELRLGIDADGARAGQHLAKGEALVHTDLDIGARQQALMNLVEKHQVRRGVPHQRWTVAPDFARAAATCSASTRSA
jgi:hypothetical protein